MSRIPDGWHRDPLQGPPWPSLSRVTESLCQRFGPGRVWSWCCPRRGFKLVVTAIWISELAKSLRLSWLVSVTWKPQPGHSSGICIVSYVWNIPGYTWYIPRTDIFHWQVLVYITSEPENRFPKRTQRKLQALHVSKILLKSVALCKIRRRCI